ncbi:heterokaryon incompatibility protein-domain-containing protein [Massariosphaeria phaeospora]|uniref:Heterokaryon incompatibility protein-domain-containing protein n=1 Tax=Massariosphaeria phaeospora TaxID=100035 RepID=A0A7C8I4R6_9PLEO|nr:heterokaryon incompatibility protein-domain-containing protein [Massariosphaeria phaeospora]
MEAKQGASTLVSAPDPTPHWATTAPYTKIQNSEIRLLRILPSRNDVTARLECNLSIHTLSGAPSFTALSYTWGVPHREIHKLRKIPSSATRQIDCNGREAQIGENLYDFLYKCAHDTSGGSHGYMWVDALCINQEDTQERSEQVQLMKEIYQNAERVIVWLGPEDMSTKPAIDLMNGLLCLEQSERLGLYPTEVRRNHTNPLLDFNNWEAVARFFQREWFNRAWIIQEVVLAQSVIVLCGAHSLSWSRLLLFSQFLATSSWTGLLKQSAGLNQYGKTISMGHTTPARLAAAKKTWQSGHDSRFLYALIRARSSDSGDDRDKVYSQLGLADVHIYPNYQISVAEVYITAAEYILGHSQSLLLLACVEGEDFQQIPGLPSWVPDWSVKKTLGLRITGYPDFHAALGIPKECALSVDKDGTRVLTMKAVQLDEIVNVSPEKRDLRDNLPNSNFLQMISELDANHRAKGTHSNPINPQYPASSEFLGPSFRNWVLWRYAASPEELKDFSHRPLASNLIPSEAEIRDAHQKSSVDPAYLDELARRASLFDVHYSHAMLLRLFITKHGYLGVGTLCLRKGDTVWIVPGCPVPLILRPIEDSDRYRLVGGSYVHGFMNGEILKREDLNFRMISLE